MNSFEINQALQDLASEGGGVLQLCRGQYWIDQPVIVPENCVIRGEFHSMPMGTPRFPMSTPGSVNTDLSYRRGTCFNVTTRQNAVRLEGDMSGIEGINFYYPEQSPIFPQFYAASVAVDSPNQSYLMGCQIRNVLFVNSFIGIEAGLGNSHIGQLSIEGLRGQPLSVGVAIDKSLDICRVKDIHFWCYWNAEAYQWMNRYGGVSMRLFRSDWQVVDDFFSYGYSIGIQFLRGSTGVTNGLFSNIQIDAAGVPLDIYEFSEVGLQFSNCNLVATHSPFAGDPRFAHQVTIPIWAHAKPPLGTPTIPTIMMNNCSIWGDLSTVVLWEHPGELLLSGSRFAPATVQNFGITNGIVKASGCSFQTPNSPNPRLMIS